VYNVEERAEEPCGGAARFIGLLSQLRDVPAPPIVLFSGDILAPSASELLGCVAAAAAVARWLAARAGHLMFDLIGVCCRSERRDEGQRECPPPRRRSTPLCLVVARSTCVFDLV
jgi:hypothetical protein